MKTYLQLRKVVVSGSVKWRFLCFKVPNKRKNHLLLTGIPYRHNDRGIIFWKNRGD